MPPSNLAALIGKEITLSENVWLHKDISTQAAVTDEANREI